MTLRASRATFEHATNYTRFLFFATVIAPDTQRPPFAMVKLGACTRGKENSESVRLVA